jgi:hypothetical protein
MSPAAEAMIDIRFLVDRETRRFFFVERANAGQMCFVISQCDKAAYVIVQVFIHGVVSQ